MTVDIATKGEWLEAEACRWRERALAAEAALERIADLRDLAKAQGKHAGRTGVRGIGAGEAELFADIAVDTLAAAER